MHFHSSHTTRPSISSISSTSTTSSIASNASTSTTSTSTSLTTTKTSDLATTLSRTPTAITGAEIQDITSIYPMTLPLDRPVTIYYKDNSRTLFSHAKAAREAGEKIVRVPTPGPGAKRGFKGFFRH